MERFWPVFFTMVQMLELVQACSDDELIPETERELNRRDFEINRSLVQRLGFEISELALANLVEQLSRSDCTWRDLATTARHSLTNVQKELSGLLLMVIPKDKIQYYESPQLFGPNVHQRFLKARDDVREAGSCFATGRYTACVFHLMRTLEYGLRALAKKLRVKLPKPLELEEWANIIGEIEKEVIKIEKQQPRTKKREKDLEFYHGAASQFRHFKNAWRNHVMHARASYDVHGAVSVMAHVSDFMQHIATRLRQ